MILDKQKMIELETRLACQEDTLNALNDIVAQQQLQIDRLEKTSKSIVDRIRKQSTIMNLGYEHADEKPPHY